MNKKEYLKNRFKRDFLQYSLLQDDSLPAKEIAGKLYNVIDIDSKIQEWAQEIKTLCDKYLSFELVKIDGKLSNELSPELSGDIKDKILTEYSEHLNGHSVGEQANAIIEKIVRGVELQTWTNGVANMQEAIKLLVERLKDSAKSYENLYTAPISDSVLLDKYKKAQENTLLERIKGDNIDDIIDYRSTLIEYVQVSCENMLYVKLKEIFNCIANNDIFDQLQSNFSNLLDYAQELKSSIIDCAANTDWDKEYNRLVPTDFYYRNVENITAEQALHMVLLQFFAKNEEWMIQNGLLESGELRVYTRDNHLGIEKLLFQFVETLLSPNIEN